MRKVYAVTVVACGSACGVLALAPRPARPPAAAPGPAAGPEAAADAGAALPGVRAHVARDAAKEHLVTGLIGGRLRLADAAEAVLALDRETPHIPPHLYNAPGRSPAVRAARLLIGRVRERLPADDPRRGPVLDRLHAELRPLAGDTD